MATIHKAIAAFLFSTSRDLRVSGNSMQPLLSDGQAIKVSPLQQPITPGKCYVFICNGALHIHRLVKIRKENFFFIGDTSQKIDRVPLGAIIAEPDSKQHLFTILILRYINLFFEKVITVYPKCKKLRKTTIRCIIRWERFYYERKI